MSITQAPKDFQTLFLDMNSFFASVEQQVQPTLRGVPIGIAPYTGDSGCIIAASKEAKASGVRIGRIGEMKKICPKIKIIESRPALYMIYHKEIIKVIESFTPYYKPLSIDEFIVRLTSSEQNKVAAEKMGNEMKKAIKEKVGDYLTCSIGIGPSRFLAKMAGERKKPDGLTVVELKDLKDFYSQLKLTDLTGINYRMETVLKNFKINSPSELFNCSLPHLQSILKQWGRVWYFRLRGYEVDDFEIKNKTIGHSHVLPPHLRSIDGAKSVIEKLIFKAGFRLRKEKYRASGVSVGICFYGGSGFHKAKRVERFCDNQSFSRHVREILKECRWRNNPGYVSVAAFGLVKQAGAQISIFSEIEREIKLSRAVDLINDEFGAGTIFPASMFLAKEDAPDRIPFGKPRYEIIN